MACIQLINALVATPDDLDFRLHLRNEFIREGMSEPFQVRDQNNTFCFMMHENLVLSNSLMKVDLPP